MANSKHLAKAGLCLNCCVCCLKPVLLTSQWIIFCQCLLVSSDLSWASASFPYVSLLNGHTVAAVCLEHEIPLLEAGKYKKNAIYLCYLKHFSGMGVYWEYKTHIHSIFLLLCSFNRIIIVPSFIKCDRLVSASFLEPCALESWHTVHWSKIQIEQMFLTLCVTLTHQSGL